MGPILHTEADNTGGGDLYNSEYEQKEPDGFCRWNTYKTSPIPLR